VFVFQQSSNLSIIFAGQMMAAFDPHALSGNMPDPLTTHHFIFRHHPLHDFASMSPTAAACRFDECLSAISPPGVNISP